MKRLFLKITLATVLLSSAVMAGPGMGPQFDQHGKYPHIFSLERFKKDISLTKDQLAKIETLNAQFKTQQMAEFESIKPLKTRLDELLIQDTPDYAAIKQTLESMAPIRIEMHLTGIRHMKEIEQVLTPEQKTKLKEIRKAKMEKFKKHHQDPKKRDRK